MKGSEQLYKRLPETPGVYLMWDAHGRILYIGKAGNLRRRVSSYFLRPHDRRIQELVKRIRKIDHKKTATALEALILEAALIKKYQPPFNIREKDDTSFLYVEITADAFPRVLLIRGKSVSPRGARRFGPFLAPKDLREALRILRRIFPWSVHAPETIGTFKRSCFEHQLGLCPGTCIGAAEKGEYRRTIARLVKVFEGKTASVARAIEKEMHTASDALDFERAVRLRRQLFGLRHIEDVALISEEEEPKTKSSKLKTGSRIEGYDISNISGTSAVGSMVVFEDGAPAKEHYRKFKIRTITGANPARPDGAGRSGGDVGMLREVLARRFTHVPPASGWPLPHLILIDGGKGQVRAAEQVLGEAGLKIPVVGIAKGAKRKKNELVGKIPAGLALRTLIRVRNEAHRFAIAYHRAVQSRRSLAHTSR